MSVVVRVDARGRFAVARAARQLGFDTNGPVSIHALADGSLRISHDDSGHVLGSRLAFATVATAARIDLVDHDLIVTPVVQSRYEHSS